MINNSELKPEHVGETVYYVPYEGATPQSGIIDSWDEHFIRVRHGKGDPEATPRANLFWFAVEINPFFNRGLEILKRYEESPTIDQMSDSVYYVGDMNVWENVITEKEVETLEDLGFTWHDGAECLMYNVIK